MQTWIWLSASGLLGVFMAVPLRKHFIEDENLPFPDGVAAGETLIMLDSRGPQARKSAYAMVGSLLASGFLFLVTQLAWIKDTIPVVVNAFSARTGVGFGLSFLNVGSGMIIGLRISASMLIGGIIGWVLAPPLLLQHGLIAPDAKRVDILLTTMWAAVGMLIAGGMTGLALRWRVLVKSFRGLAAKGTSQDLPLKWVLLGGGASAVFLAIVTMSSSERPIGIRRSRSRSRCRSDSWRCVCSARRTGDRSARWSISCRRSLASLLLAVSGPAWCRAASRARWRRSRRA